MLLAWWSSVLISSQSCNRTGIDCSWRGQFWSVRWRESPTSRWRTGLCAATPSSHWASRADSTSFSPQWTWSLSDLFIYLFFYAHCCCFWATSVFQTGWKWRDQVEERTPVTARVLSPTAVAVKHLIWLREAEVYPSPNTHTNWRRVSVMLLSANRQLRPVVRFLRCWEMQYLQSLSDGVKRKKVQVKAADELRSWSISVFPAVWSVLVMWYVCRFYKWQMEVRIKLKYDASNCIFIVLDLWMRQEQSLQHVGLCLVSGGKSLTAQRF